MKKNNLVYVLGEDVTELAFYYFFYPNRKFMLEVIEIESYKQMKYRKKTKEGKLSTHFK